MLRSILTGLDIDLKGNGHRTRLGFQDVRRYDPLRASIPGGMMATAANESWWPPVANKKMGGPKRHRLKAQEK